MKQIATSAGRKGLLAPGRGCFIYTKGFWQCKEIENNSDTTAMQLYYYQRQKNRSNVSCSKNIIKSAKIDKISQIHARSHKIEKSGQLGAT